MIGGADSFLQVSAALYMPQTGAGLVRPTSALEQSQLMQSVAFADTDPESDAAKDEYPSPGA